MNSYKEKNILLARDDVGKPKPSTKDLPTAGHSYGVKNRQEEFGVGKLTSSWHLPAITLAKKGELDFKKLNKMGVPNKIIKPYQVREFRQNLGEIRILKKQSYPVGRSSSTQHFNTVEQVVNPDPAAAASIKAFGKQNRA